MLTCQRKPHQLMADQSTNYPSRVERAVLDELATQSGLPPAEIASLLRLNQADLGQRVQDPFTELDQGHLNLLAGLFRHGLAVFDQHIASFTKWLQTPHPELACDQTGFPTLEPITPPLPLEEMGSIKRFDLMAYSAQSDPPSAPAKPYPTPFSLLDTASGIRLVDDIFVRIEAGVYW